MWSATLGLVLAASLQGCAGALYSNPPDVAKRDSYTAQTAPEIGLVTITHKPTQFMWHSALLINADERILYESGGYWIDSEDRRLGDVHYNLTDARLNDYVARRGNPKVWKVTLHRVDVSPEVAQEAKRRAEENQLVLAGFCAVGVAEVLKDLPGFDHIGHVLLPHDLTPRFDEIPGVRVEVLSGGTDG